MTLAEIMILMMNTRTEEGEREGVGEAEENGMKEEEEEYKKSGWRRERGRG